MPTKLVQTDGQTDRQSDMRTNRNIANLGPIAVTLPYAVSLTLDLEWSDMYRKGMTILSISNV